MGQLLGTEEETKEKCLENCPMKRRRETSSLQGHASALRNSRVFLKVILLKGGIEKCWKQMRNLPEVMEIGRSIILILLDLELYSMIIASTSLPFPWMKDDIELASGQVRYTLLPPNKSIVSGHTTMIDTITLNGSTFVIPRYFWYDDIYHNKVCHCSDLKEQFLLKLRKNREIKCERLLNMLGPNISRQEIENTTPFTPEKEEEEYQKFLKNEHYITIY